MKPILVLVGIVLLLLITDVGCVFKAVLGVPCPGCGQTRAWFALFGGRMAEAFYWHPLFWLTPILLLLALVRNERVFTSRRLNALFWIVCLLLYVGVYIWRLVVLFPEHPPMDLNESAPALQFLSQVFD